MLGGIGRDTCTRRLAVRLALDTTRQSSPSLGCWIARLLKWTRHWLALLSLIRLERLVLICRFDVPRQKDLRPSALPAMGTSSGYFAWRLVDAKGSRLAYKPWCQWPAVQSSGPVQWMPQNAGPCQSTRSSLFVGHLSKC